MIPPAELIRIERRRQIDKEGYTAAHDDQYKDGELMDAAMCYYLFATGKAGWDEPHPATETYTNNWAAAPPPLGWPWAAEWWKPQSQLRCLVKAGALMLAETERLQRAYLPIHHVSHKLSFVLTALEKVPQE
jgi:hypothetical protein